jgi:hypothetical protein
MHSSLKLKTNIVIIVTCGIVAAIVTTLSHPFPVASLILGVLTGLTAGYLQRKSIASTPSAFKSAETAMAVRQALTSTTSGKRAIQIQWVFLPLLIVISFRNGNPLGAVAGFAIFMCVRDLVGLSAVKGLSMTTATD